MSEHSDHTATHLDTDALARQFTSGRLYAHEVEAGRAITGAQATAALRMLPGLRAELDRVERRLTEGLLASGQTWEAVAAETGRTSRQAAQQRYARLGGERSGSSGSPAGYAPVEHPGSIVPAEQRSWQVDWPGYAPVDVTPPELRLDALAEHVPDWAEPAATPEEITDWSARVEQALVPFGFDARGWPLHPQGRTGRTGRNLGKWGENQAADPIVMAGHGSRRHVLLIERADGAGWALPGGMVDPGETAPATLVRELAEETGVDLRDQKPTILTRQLVDDWRNTDHAWVATTAALYLLDEQAPATAGDDATRAAWFPASDLPTLSDAVQQAGGTLYDAHRELLARALDEADRHQL